MRAGDFDHVLRIERQVQTRDPNTNEVLVSWATWADDVYAQVLDILPGSAESSMQGVMMRERPATVRVRYMVGLTADMRFIDKTDGNRVLVPLSGPAVFGRRERMDFVCKTFTTAGQGG